MRACVCVLVGCVSGVLLWTGSRESTVVRIVSRNADISFGDSLQDLITRF